MSKQVIIIDLQNVATKADLHTLFKERLHFPDWYGANWDAFWDCIIAVVPMPTEVRLVNWRLFATSCPHDMGILREIIADYACEAPGRCLVLVPAVAATPAGGA